MPQMRDLKTEVFKVVYLNSNNRIIEIADAATGTVNHAMPIVREIIHAALQNFQQRLSAFTITPARTLHQARKIKNLRRNWPPPESSWTSRFWIISLSATATTSALRMKG